MQTFNIYRFDFGVGRRLVETNVVESNERLALALFANRNGIRGPVKRDGGGLLYVGDAEQGRFYAKRVPTKAERAEVEAWRAKYPNVPFGTPVVLAEAITQSGGLA